MTSGSPFDEQAPIGQGPVVRPARSFKKRLTSFAMAHMEPAFALVRACWPILVTRKLTLVSRYDDVREIFIMDPAFGVPYKDKLDVIVDKEPFFLSMEDTPTYREQVGALREVVRPDDVPARIVPAVEARVREALPASGGRIDVVALVRDVCFAEMLDYFGVPRSPLGDIVLWSTRIFEFQFLDQDDDQELDGEIRAICPAMRAHVQGAIEARRASGEQKDDVLGRCLARQAGGDARYSDQAIRNGLIGCIAGGVPQHPMAAPQILDQLLRRPDALAAAARAARESDDSALLAHVLEALRFDAMAKFLQRVTIADHTLAAGTPRAKTIKKGTPILIAPASAMMDGRRIADPRRYDATRPAESYMHFGLGHHQCFGLYINRGVLPAVLKPLLAAKNLQRAAGASGRLRKQGAFPDRFVVRFDPG